MVKNHGSLCVRRCLELMNVLSNQPDYKVLALLHGGVAAREVEAKGLAIIIRIGPPADLKNNRYLGILI